MTGIRYLTVDHLRAVAEAATGGQVAVRDEGLLASAVARPATALFGAEQYPGLLDKAAALMHSIARFHPLVDGNKRLAWLAMYTAATLNGAQVVATNEEAFQVTMALAGGDLDEVADIVDALEPLVRLPAGPG